MEDRRLRYERGLEKCLTKASTAQTAELRELWETMADSYRHLLDTDKRTLTFHSWMRHNFA